MPRSLDRWPWPWAEKRHVVDNRPQLEEQLRRLKNTVMGASQRFLQLAASGELPGESARELSSISRDLAKTAQRLERLLAGLRQRG